MQLHARDSRQRGTSVLRVILVIVAIVMTINLAFQIRKIWNRLTAKPSAIEAASASEPSETNAPPAQAATNLPALQPLPATAVASDAPAPMVPLVPPGAERAAPPTTTKKPAATESGAGSPRGFGSMGFPPRVTPVVFYQPGTLTFVAIPFDDDDLTKTNRVDAATNQVDHLRQRRMP